MVVEARRPSGNKAKCGKLNESAHEVEKTNDQLFSVPAIPLLVLCVCVAGTDTRHCSGLDPGGASERQDRG